MWLWIAEIIFTLVFLIFLMLLSQLQLAYLYNLELSLTVLQNYRITVFVNLWLILKRLGGINLTPPPPCGFSKNVSSIERVKAWFFVTFNIILGYIFPENFLEFPQVVQKILRNSQWILANFHQFSSIFSIFWHYLVTKKLITSPYNRWCQHFFTFNIL